MRSPSSLLLRKSRQSLEYVGSRHYICKDCEWFQVKIRIGTKKKDGPVSGLKSARPRGRFQSLGAAAPVSLPVSYFRQVQAYNDASLLYHELFSLYVHIPRRCSSSSLSSYHSVSHEFLSLPFYLLRRYTQKGFISQHMPLPNFLSLSDGVHQASVFIHHVQNLLTGSVFSPIDFH